MSEGEVRWATQSQATVSASAVSLHLVRVATASSAAFTRTELYGSRDAIRSAASADATAEPSRRVRISKGETMICQCEDYPCCGHGDDNPSSPYANMTDAEIKQMVYDRFDDPDYDPDEFRGEDW